MGKEKIETIWQAISSIPLNCGNKTLYRRRYDITLSPGRCEIRLQRPRASTKISRGASRRTYMSRANRSEWGTGIIELYERRTRSPRATSRRNHFPREDSTRGTRKENVVNPAGFQIRDTARHFETFPLCHRARLVRPHASVGRAAVAPSDAVLRLSNCLASSFLCVA